MNIERLNSLASIDFTNFIQSENNVKYKIVIPFLQSFNHVDLDLEHATQGSRIDINIGNRIIVETKALGQNINMHVQQLAEYSVALNKHICRRLDNKPTSLLTATAENKF